MDCAAADRPEDLATLQARLREGEQIQRQLQRENTALQREIALLRERLNLLLAQRFGPSSEKLPEAQLRLFDEAEHDAAEAPQPPEARIEVGPHSRARGGRRPLPEALPRVEVFHDLPAAEKVCPHDGTPLQRIGEETAEQLDIVPATVRVLRHIRPTYACPCCQAHLLTAPLPPQPIPKSLASPGLLAHVVVSKYLDALPLYRQERIFQRMGVALPRATLAQWMIRAGALVQPLINLLRDQLLAGAVIHCDETTVQVLKEPGKAAASTSYMWVQLSGRYEPPVVLFDYDPSRAGAIPTRLLEGFHGLLHTDGYEGYAAVCRDNGLIAIGCWAHVRRKFDEALKAAGINPRQPPAGAPPPKARRTLKALGFIQRLFAIEHRIRQADAPTRHQVRQAESAPVIEAFRSWLDETLPVVLPGSALGKALAYADGQWPRLTAFLDDGRAELHNNRAENAIRPFVVGRKNWLFADTVAGAQASANLYSLIETAKANALEPYTYLRRVFTELPQAESVEAIEALLPWQPQDPGTDIDTDSATRS